MQSRDELTPAGSLIPGLVSVVIPSYQRGYVLGRAIASALEQTYRPQEVIIVDDGSSDDTREVVARFGDQVRYHFQANAGVSAARNAGMRLARGEYIAFLDSDDQWLPWKLDLQVAFLRRFPTLGMVWTDMAAVGEDEELVSPAYLRTLYHAYHYIRTEEMFSESGNLRTISAQLPAEFLDRNFFRGDIFSPMLLGNLVHTSTVLLRRERQRAVGNFDESIRQGGEDYEFHLATCAQGPVGYLDLSSILYRVGAEDQFVKPAGGIHFARSNLQTLLTWLDLARARVALPEELLRRRIADSYVWLGFEELKEGATRVARSHLWQSWRLRPWHVRTAVLLACSCLPAPVFRALRRARAAWHGMKPT